MNKKLITATAAVGVLLAASLGVFLFNGQDQNKANAQYTIEPKVIQENGKTVKEFNLVAQETKWQLNDKQEVIAWTYNGVVPGSQIRVKQGDIVRVTLKNELKEPTSIHWHGYPVPNNMDGIPGVTQNALRPGETFTYEFEASVPGTYWYHSHQDSATQEDKGLYGTFIVEAKEDQSYNRDYTLVLDEWSPSFSEMDHSKMNMGGMDHSKMSNMDHGSMNMGQQNAAFHSSMAGMNNENMNMPPGAMHDDMMKSMYTVFSVNGKSGESIEPLEVAKGEKIRLRFVNAGFQSHTLHLHGQEYKIIAADGQKIENPTVIKDQPFIIAPGERYDIEVNVNTEENWFIESHDKSEAAKGMTIPVKVKDAKATLSNKPSTNDQQPIDLTAYGQGKGKFDLTMKYDLEYSMVLGEQTGKNGPMDPVFTINGKSFPNVDPVKVKKGDKVKVTLMNKGTSNHPMHLHGHFFQVLSKDGKPVTGAPMMKDTLNIKPGESYVVAFEADNTGDWMFHCHDLHHAAAGMVASVLYEGYTPFTADPTVGNKGD